MCRAVRNRNIGENMKFSAHIAVAAMLPAVLTACTELQTFPLSKLTTTKEPEGVVYFLPMAQFDIRLDRQVTACKDEIEVAMEAAVVPRFTADPSASFYLPYEELRDGMKTSEIEVKLHPNQMLMSVNVGVEDRSAQVSLNVAKAGINIAKIALGLPPAPGAQLTPPPPGQVKSACTPEVAEAVRKLKEKTPELKSAAKAVASQTELVGQLRRALEITQQPSPERLRELEAALSALEARVSELNRLQEEIEALKKITVATQSLVWPLSGDVYGPERIEPSAQLVAQWFTFLSDADNEKLLVATVELSRVGSAPGIGVGEDPKEATGIHYRQPLPGRISLCRGSQSTCQDIPIKDRIYDAIGLAPQLGIAATLPLKNRAFQNNRLEVAFDESGSLVSLAYKDKAAQAEVATSALADATSLFPSLGEQIQAKELLDQQREVALLGEQVKLLEAQVKQKKLQEELSPVPTAEFEAATALTNAETENINAQIALLKAKQELELLDED